MDDQKKPDLVYYWTSIINLCMYEKKNFLEQFFQKLEVWSEECQSKEYPHDIARAQEMLTRHEQLKETCHALCLNIRAESLKLVEKLRMPVGEGSLPTGFVQGTRHVKEILENVFDEKNWMDEQWKSRHTVLFQALNFRKFQEEAKKVRRSSWGRRWSAIGVCGVRLVLGQLKAVMKWLLLLFPPSPSPPPPPPLPLPPSFPWHLMSPRENSSAHVTVCWVVLGNVIKAVSH